MDATTSAASKAPLQAAMAAPSWRWQVCSFFFACVLASVICTAEFLLGPVFIAVDVPGSKAAGWGPLAPTTHQGQILNIYLTVRNKFVALGQFATSSVTG